MTPEFSASEGIHIPCGLLAIGVRFSVSLLAILDEVSIASAAKALGRPAGVSGTKTKTSPHPPVHPDIPPALHTQPPCKRVSGLFLDPTYISMVSLTSKAVKDLISINNKFFPGENQEVAWLLKGGTPKVVRRVPDPSLLRRTSKIPPIGGLSTCWERAGQFLCHDLSGLGQPRQSDSSCLPFSSIHKERRTPAVCSWSACTLRSEVNYF